MPNNANAETIVVAMAQIWIVQPLPSLSSIVLRRRGKAKSPMPDPEKMIPPASPRRSENHLGSGFTTGIYGIPPATPIPTPFNRISYHTFVAQSDRNREPI
ncbi:hypothetical protein BD310DRAFT_927961 [Dichomitus squalens]|uniref:Uncharacterized protein n=1 Tax=Dichomitus squalens TaxID=114155 RepID=A0A4Q9PUF4_9APHY|nr:hypothetical protein BD310DRAFT_927961 [Dichomitus squalens]